MRKGKTKLAAKAAKSAKNAKKNRNDVRAGEREGEGKLFYDLATGYESRVRKFRTEHTEDTEQNQNKRVNSGLAVVWRGE